MLGTLFFAFLITLIIGGLIATLGDEFGMAWRTFVDFFHVIPEEQKLKEIRRSLSNY